MDNSYRLLDLTVYGRQEDWEDSPAGWPQHWGEVNHPFRRDGRPISQWRRLDTGHSDDLGSNRGGGPAADGEASCCGGKA